MSLSSASSRTVLRPAPRLRFTRKTGAGWNVYTGFAVMGILFGFGAAAFGLPEMNLHGPWYEKGFLTPTCGLTRATRYFFAGDFALAMRFNPSVIVIVGAAVALVGRQLYGMVTGRWLGLAIPDWRHPRVITGLVVLSLLVLALWLRQIANADFIIANPA